MASSNKAQRLHTQRYGKTTGPAHMLEYLAQNEIQDRHKSSLRQTAQRLILENRVPDCYVTLVADPFSGEKLTTVDLVVTWLLAIEQKKELPLSEIDFSEIQSRFASHLHDVFHPCGP